MKKISISKKLKLFFLKLARARASTLEIAWGAAIGTFISVFPTFGFGMPFVVLLRKFFKLNLIAALALSVVSNPFTSPFFMLLSFKVGSLILSTEIDFNIKEWKHQLGEAGLTILIGALIVSSTVSLIVYFGVKYFVQKYRMRKVKQTESRYIKFDMYR